MRNSRTYSEKTTDGSSEISACCLTLFFKKRSAENSTNKHSSPAVDMRCPVIFRPFLTGGKEEEKGVYIKLISGRASSAGRSQLAIGHEKTCKAGPKDVGESRRCNRCRVERKKKTLQRFFLRSSRLASAQQQRRRAMDTGRPYREIGCYRDRPK